MQCLRTGIFERCVTFAHENMEKDYKVMSYDAARAFLANPASVKVGTKQVITYAPDSIKPTVFTDTVAKMVQDAMDNNRKNKDIEEFKVVVSDFLSKLTNVVQKIHN